MAFSLPIQAFIYVIFVWKKKEKKKHCRLNTIATLFLLIIGKLSRKIRQGNRPKWKAKKISK